MAECDRFRAREVGRSEMSADRIGPKLCEALSSLNRMSNIWPLPRMMDVLESTLQDRLQGTAQKVQLRNASQLVVIKP